MQARAKKFYPPSAGKYIGAEYVCPTRVFPTAPPLGKWAGIHEDGANDMTEDARHDPAYVLKRYFQC